MKKLTPGLAQLTYFVFGLLLICSTAGVMTAAEVTPTTITINWSASGDDGYAGLAIYYDLRYSEEIITEDNFYQATPAKITGRPQIPHARETHTITGLEEDTWYYIALRIGDEVPNWSDMSNPCCIKTADTMVPGPINNLRAYSTEGDELILRWTASGDNGLAGQGTYYQIQFSSDTAKGWTDAFNTPKPAMSGTRQEYRLENLSIDDRYWVRIRTIDEAHNLADWSNETEAIVGDEHYYLPDQYLLDQNYPNPFNPITTIHFEIFQPGDVRLAIFNILGQKVTDLVNGFLDEGQYETIWDGRDDNGQRVASGIYFYRLTAQDFTQTRKMVFLK